MAVEMSVELTKIVDDSEGGGDDGGGADGPSGTREIPLFEARLELGKDPDPEGATEAKPRFRRRKQARPEELIAAAVELFGEQGFAATTLKDVAKRAGVSKGTVYLYFKSKEELLRAAVRTSVVPIVDLSEELEVDEDGAPAEVLRLLVERWVDEFETRGVTAVPKLVMAEAANFPELAQDYVASVLSRVRRLVARLLKRGIRAGVFVDMDVREATHLLLAPLFYGQIHAASLAPFDPQAPDLREFVSGHLDFFLRGIAVGAGE